MELLIDTNVILDYLLGDGDFDNIIEVIRSIERKEFVGCITASAVTDIHHIMVRRLLDDYKTQGDGSLSNRKAKQEIKVKVTNDMEELLSLFRILTVCEKDVQDAFALRWKDFEDAVQYSVALNNGIAHIVTHNVKDFEQPRIPVSTPEQFLREAK